METVLRESEQQSLLAVDHHDRRLAQGPPGAAVPRRLAAGASSRRQRARHHARGALRRAAHRRARGRMGHRCAQPHPRRGPGRRLPAAAGGHARALAVPRAAGARRQGGLRRLDARAARFREHRRPHLAGLRRQARRPAAAVLRQHRRRQRARRAASKRANTAARKRSKSRASRRSGSARATATCSRSASRCRCVGQHIGVLIDDRDRRGAARSSYGTLDVADLRATGRLIAASPDLNDHLRQFAQPGVELTVASSTGAILTRLDAPALPGDYTRMRGFLPRMYRLFLDGDAIPRSVSQAERQRAARRPHRARGARQAGDRAVRRPLRKQRHRRRGRADLLGRRQARLRRHPARADRRSLAHAARPRAHAAAESHAVRHAVRGGRGILVRRPHDPAHLAARRGQRNGAGPRGQPVARAARGRRPRRARRPVAQLLLAARPAR